MTTETLEKRVERLEAQMEQLTQTLPAANGSPWWKCLVGVYKDDPEFDAAEKLGQEYRVSLRPSDDEDAS